MNTITTSTPNPNKKTYKVLYPVEKKGGGTAYWLRLGTAFTNKDNSLNVVLDAMPPSNNISGRPSYQLHIRELNEEDFRRREAYNASRGSSQTNGYGGNSNGYGQDLGGIGGGPTASSRAVTASSSLSANDPLDDERSGNGPDGIPF